MTSRRIALCVSCIIAGSISTASAVEEVDVVQKTGIPSFILPAVFEQLAAKDPAGKGLPVPFTVADAEGKPAANQKLLLRHAGGEETVTTDGDGQVTVYLNVKNAAGLKLVLPDGFNAKSEIGDQIQVTRHTGNGQMKDLDVDQLTLMRGRHGLSVYAAKNIVDAGAKLLDSLAERRGFALGRYGLRLFDGFGVAVVPDAGSYRVKGKMLIPVTVDPASKRIDPIMTWGLTHEWVETSLVLDSRVYAKEKNLRFLGDGLADLIAYNYCMSRPDGEGVAANVLATYRGHLVMLQRKGVKSFDLAKEFPAGELNGTVGYAASFHFWNRIEKEHGPAAITDFIAWFRKRKDTSVAEVLAKLEELTGEEQKTELPVEEMLEAYRDLVPPRPFLGVVLQDLTVGDMQPGGPAEKGGVKRGDVITRLNGKAVQDFGHFVATLAELQPGRKAELGVSRQGEDHVLTVTIGSH